MASIPTVPYQPRYLCLPNGADVNTIPAFYLDTDWVPSRQDAPTGLIRQQSLVESVVKHSGASTISLEVSSQLLTSRIFRDCKCYPGSEEGKLPGSRRLSQEEGQQTYLAVPCLRTRSMLWITTMGSASLRYTTGSWRRWEVGMGAGSAQRRKERTG